MYLKLERTKINEEEAGNGPFKRTTNLIEGLDCGWSNGGRSRVLVRFGRNVEDAEEFFEQQILLESIDGGP